MKMAFTWFTLFCKRYLKKKGIVISFLLLPVVSWLLGIDHGPEKDGIQIGVYLEKTETGQQEEIPYGWEQMGRQLTDALNSREDIGGIFQISLCESEEKLMDLVAAKKLECGYVIPENLGVLLRDKKAKKAIKTYLSPSTVTGALSEEVIFSVLANLYDRQLLIDYLKDDNVGKLYDDWYRNGKLFQFQYVYEKGHDIQEEIPTDSSVFPVKGIAAVFVFVMTLYSACVLMMDERKGLYGTLCPRERRVCQMSSFLALPVLATAAGFLALAVGGMINDGLLQLAEIGIYGLACCVYALFLKQLIRNEKVLFCLLPFFIMGSLIFTPVFVEIGRWVPEIGWIGRLFPPHYYLR